MLADKIAETNGDGKADVKFKVVHNQLRVEKKYYESFSAGVLVPLGGQDKAVRSKLKAKAGRCRSAL
ncbi:hypothetical protein IRY61_06270 [Candidatus Saccharibacteria bacterium]|nr:hypothetical protein [Candidatus Saccharibacteria bacterium]